MNNVHFSSNSNEWETPQCIFDKLNSKFSFIYDLASSDNNHKCKQYYTKKDNSLSKDWSLLKDWCFLNPPYGRDLSKWVQKAYKSKSKIVMLIPARTDTRYWHDYIFGKASVYFIKGRLKFELNKKQLNSAPFPSAIVIYGLDKKEIGVCDFNE